jgi:hypothetical protein
VRFDRAVSQTASQNAAAEAALSTQQLALGIAEIDATARALSDQAEQLENLLGKFIFAEPSRTAVERPLEAATARGVSRK